MECSGFSASERNQRASFGIERIEETAENPVHREATVEIQDGEDAGRNIDCE